MCYSESNLETSYTISLSTGEASNASQVKSDDGAGSAPKIHFIHPRHVNYILMNSHCVSTVM